MTIFNDDLAVAQLEVTDSAIRVWLNDGRTLTVPVGWFPDLESTDPLQWGRWIPTGSGVRWPDLGVETKLGDLLADSPLQHPEGIDHARLANVDVTNRSLCVWLNDGRTLTVPLWWFPRLCDGTPEERNGWHIRDGGTDIVWKDLDEVYYLEDLLAGGWSRESARSLGRWLLARREGRPVAAYQISKFHKSMPQPEPLT